MKTLYTWATIGAVVIQSSAGDVLLARAMRQIGDLEALRRQSGLWRVVRTVLTNRIFLLAILFMALAFFTLLMALSWADVSLVGPASASLTFITNAIGAKIFLHENVNRRRWGAALFVAAGVALLAA